MFIATNRFRVIPAETEAFERAWLTRESHLKSVPGFLVFHLLRGPRAEDHVLYSALPMQGQARRSRPRSAPRSSRASRCCRRSAPVATRRSRDGARALSRGDELDLDRAARIGEPRHDHLRRSRGRAIAEPGVACCLPGGARLGRR